MGSNSQKRVRMVRESSQGVLPAGNMEILPFERFKLASPVSREEPGNVASDRQVYDNPETDVSITGSASADFLITQYLTPMESVFCNARVAAASSGSVSLTAVASGNKITRGAGSFVTDGFTVGMFVQVTGFTTNGAHFLALVTGVVALELTIDANYKTLVNEGPVSVTIKNSNSLTLGTSTLTQSVEIFNTGSSRGMNYLGVGFSEFGLDFNYPGRGTCNFSMVGMTTGTQLAAANANASTAALTRKLCTSRLFGDGANPTFGYGFRLAGTVISPRFKKVSLKLTSGLLADGGLGVFGPQDMTLDGRFKLMLELEVLWNTAAADDLIDDALDPATNSSIGFGVADRNGLRAYFYMPSMQPVDAPDPNEVQQSGRDTVVLKYVGAADSGTHGMIRYTEFAT